MTLKREDVMAKMELFLPVSNLGDLEQMGRLDPRYVDLAVSAAKHLGGPHVQDLESAMRWLRFTQEAAGAEIVVAAVNACRDAV